MPPLVFGLEYYGPHLPTGPGAVPILSNSTRPQTVWRLLTGLLSWPPTSYSFLASPLGRVFFPSKASAGTCAVQKRGQDQGCPPNSHQRTHAPQSVLRLWPSVCTPTQAREAWRKMDKRSLIKGRWRNLHLAPLWQSPLRKSRQIGTSSFPFGRSAGDRPRPAATFCLSRGGSSPVFL